MRESPPQILDTNRLYRDYATAVTRWASSLSRSHRDAEDIVQDVFLVVERQRATLAPLRSPAAWLYQITHNIVRRRWRDKLRGATSKGLDALVDDAPSPFDSLERRQSLEQVERAFVALGPRDQRLIWLSDVQGIPTAQISRLTGIRPETLRVRRHRARRQLTRRVRHALGTWRPAPECRAP
jgi:RNA polymerase sigma-70 factor (ECF subfamily)